MPVLPKTAHQKCLCQSLAPPPIAKQPSKADGFIEVVRQEALLKTGALQNAIFNSANFSSIATDAKGVIQIFNVGAERMLGYAAAEVVNQITRPKFQTLKNSLRGLNA